jgi:hypothetical protein
MVGGGHGETLPTHRGGQKVLHFDWHLSRSGSQRKAGCRAGLNLYLYCVMT